MSPFIDSMATPEEVDRLEAHVLACGPCQRQLQSFISVRNLLARVERPAPPEDLALRARVRLSRERNRNYLGRLETRLSNFFKPIAIPAVLGVSFTALFFGVLLASLISNPSVMANDRVDDVPISLMKPVRTTDPTMIRFAVNGSNWEEPLTIETFVGEDGRVIDYRILAGPNSPEVDRWLRELLHFAEFTPATVFGRPVGSRIILSFVRVRS